MNPRANPVGVASQIPDHFWNRGRQGTEYSWVQNIPGSVQRPSRENRPLGN